MHKELFIPNCISASNRNKAAVGNRYVCTYTYSFRPKRIGWKHISMAISHDDPSRSQRGPVDFVSLGFE